MNNIQLIVNSTLVREFDIDTFIKKYAKICYVNEDSVTNNILIKQNILKLLDWDCFGHNGLGIYCSKYESLKRKDVSYLVDLVKEYKKDIIKIGEPFAKQAKIEENKRVLKYDELRKQQEQEYYCNEKYKPVSPRAKSCEYQGKFYKSRQECRFKEGLSVKALYKYLKATNQV